jgi:hypothetical protein
MGLDCGAGRTGSRLVVAITLPAICGFESRHDAHGVPWAISQHDSLWGRGGLGALHQSTWQQDSAWYQHNGPCYNVASRHVVMAYSQITAVASWVLIQAHQGC